MASIEEKPEEDRALLDAARSARELAVALGVALVVLGVIAITVPSFSTVVGTLFLGGILLASGVVRFVRALEDRGSPDGSSELLSALLAVVAGTVIVLFPAVGILTMTMLLGAFFVVGGVVKVIRAVQRHDVAAWGWHCFSGLVTTVLGVLLLARLPGTATWVLGLIIGVDLVVEGVALIGGSTKTPSLVGTWRRRLGSTWSHP